MELSGVFSGIEGLVLRGNLNTNISSIEYMVRNLNKKERFSGLRMMLEEEFI